MTSALQPAGPISLRGDRRRRDRERIVRGVLVVAALSSILISLGIVATVAIEAIEFLTQIELAWLVEIGWFPRRDMFDVLTLLLGTGMVTLIAMAIAGGASSMGDSLGAFYVSLSAVVEALPDP